ncbi:unnamed protein product [Caenorhabditis brenneri]
MKMNENKTDLPINEKTLTLNDYLSKSSDTMVNSSLNHKDELGFKGDYHNLDEDLSLERGESSSYYPLDDHDLTSEGEIENSDDEGMTDTKRESMREKFRRFRHKEYQCDDCDRMFTLKHNLQNHFVQYHMGCKILHKPCASCKCNICGKIYSAAAVLAEHMLQEHNQYTEYEECSKCFEKFLTYAALQKHMKEHNQADRVCPYSECNGLKFKLRKELNEHVRLGHKLKELSCSVCNMVFRQLSAKIKHEKEHEKELRENSERYRAIGREGRAKCDEDLVKREPESPTTSMKKRRAYSPVFEAVPIKKKTMKRLTKAEILAKIK